MEATNYYENLKNTRRFMVSSKKKKTDKKLECMRGTKNKSGD
jgi:hypothetical protein